MTCSCKCSFPNRIDDSTNKNYDFCKNQKKMIHSEKWQTKFEGSVGRMEWVPDFNFAMSQWSDRGGNMQHFQRDAWINQNCVISLKSSQIKTKPSRTKPNRNKPNSTEPNWTEAKIQELLHFGCVCAKGFSTVRFNIFKSYAFGIRSRSRKTKTHEIINFNLTTNRWLANAFLFQVKHWRCFFYEFSAGCWNLMFDGCSCASARTRDDDFANRFVELKTKLIRLK